MYEIMLHVVWGCWIHTLRTYASWAVVVIWSRCVKAWAQIICCCHSKHYYDCSNSSRISRVEAVTLWWGMVEILSWFAAQWLFAGADEVGCWEQLFSTSYFCWNLDTDWNYLATWARWYRIVVQGGFKLRLCCIYISGMICCLSQTSVGIKSEVKWMMKASVQHALGCLFALLRSLPYGRQEDAVYTCPRPSAWTPLDLCHAQLWSYSTVLSSRKLA